VPPGSKGISRLSAASIVCATLSVTTGLAHAGARADQITQLRRAAQLGHESTPESVGQAPTHAQLSFAAALAQAEAQTAGWKLSVRSRCLSWTELGLVIGLGQPPRPKAVDG
jgi:hypothetical protein